MLDEFLRAQLERAGFAVGELDELAERERFVVGEVGDDLLRERVEVCGVGVLNGDLLRERVLNSVMCRRPSRSSTWRSVSFDPSMRVEEPTL